MASTPELSLECRLREFLMRVSQMKHLGHNEFPFEDVSHNWAYFDYAPGSSRATNPKRAVHRKKAIFHDFAWETPDFEIAAGS